MALLIVERFGGKKEELRYIKITQNILEIKKLERSRRKADAKEVLENLKHCLNDQNDN